MTAGSAYTLLLCCVRRVVQGSLLAIVLAFVACSSSERNRNEIPKLAESTRQSLTQLTRQGAVEKFDPLVVTNKVWVGDVALRIQRGVPLPPKYETERGVTLVTAEPMTVAEITTAITAQTGIPIRVADIGGAKGAEGGGMGGGRAGAFGGQAEGGGEEMVSPKIPMSYEGSLSGLLDRVAGSFGTSWKYDGKVIRMSRYDTRVFMIEALPGTLSTSVEVHGGSTSGGGGGGGGGAGGSASGSSTIESKASVDLKYWEELEKVLQAMIGGVGNIVLSPALGTVTVTTTPEVMASIATYVAQENERLSRQIAVNVEVYNLSLSKNEDFNVAFSSFISKASGPFALSGGSTPASVSTLTGLASANIAILDGKVTDVFQSLSQIGQTTRVAQFPFMTLNNRPVSVRVGRDITYIAKTDSTPSTSGTSTVNTVTATQGQINEGVSMQISPRILEDGRVLIQYSLSSSDLDELKTFNTQCGVITSSSTCTGGDGSSTLQNPTTTTRNFTQQAVLRSGSTLIIGGVNQRDAKSNAQGVGDPFNFLLGGGSTDANTDTMMMIAITPQIVGLPRAEHN